MPELKPRAPVRRFDVFAEYSRLKAMDKDKLPASRAKGYGLWLAKVVASRRFGQMPKAKPDEKPKEEDGKKEAGKKQARSEELDSRGWHLLSGIPQTDRLFDREVVTRMGKEFYTEVFAPAVRQAYTEGKPYTTIRDAIRKNWEPRP